MALSDAQRAALTVAAIEAGVKPSIVISEAESMVGGGEDGEATKPGGRPLFERMLIGAFPFVRVRELRQHWLGLSDSIEDEDLSCLEYELKIRQKYGGGGAAPAAFAGEPEE